jgi:cation diffusion facilitator family transporter
LHVHTLEKWQHSHEFYLKNEKGEQRTTYVLLLTAITMVVEIVAGNIYGSMALLADGWHMGTHVAAFMIAIFAYRYARKHANNPAYTFGTGKVNALGGFASAVALAVVALVMLIESIQRLINPHEIHFNQSIIVAAIGLLINLISALLLKDNHSHDHGDHHDHNHGHHHDHNLRAAYIHVLADTLTSMFAIVALLAGKYLGWNWLDPTMGIVGAVIITRWSIGLLKQTGPLLLDASVGEEYQLKIKETVERDSDNRISDIHIWRVGIKHYAAIISLVTHFPKPTEHYKKLLKDFRELSHTTIEVSVCVEEPCIVSESGKR